MKDERFVPLDDDGRPNKQKSLVFMEIFPYLIFLDLDKMDVCRDKPSFFCSSRPRASLAVL
jgi:hypothetical protein